MAESKIALKRNAGLAAHLKKFDLDVSDLVKESGRSRDSLNGWWIRDKKIISALIRATLTRKYTHKLKVLDTQDLLIK